MPEVAKKHGISAQTIYGWRKHFGTLEPTDVKRLRHLEQENSRLKKMVADRDLEVDVLKEITRRNGRRTRAPAAGRVCTITRFVRPPRVRLALDRTVHHRVTSRLAEKDARVLGAMRECAAQYPRYGYRKIRIFLGRRGYPMSAQRTYRLWRQAGLQVPRRRPRRRVASGRPRPVPASRANEVWAYDSCSIPARMAGR